ncbi:DgyrCDS4905 [Dimorphilus gyrociliatus]|uniref:DgyrCDS4905 n=1 Tax=Dimorphilus gyrociliatus TaxID=2664684 RepID=A0A7I8VIF6_9ANNE|nr:DgyrCDS4905 [Dimorphilus gyrociliatus]
MGNAQGDLSDLEEDIAKIFVSALKNSNTRNTQRPAEAVKSPRIKQASIWDEEKTSSSLRIEADGLTVSKIAERPSSHIAKAAEGYTDGLHIFKIHWPQKKRGLCAVIGVSSQMAPIQNFQCLPLCGLNQHSLGWDIVNNKALYGGMVLNTYPEDRNPGYSVSDTFFMILDLQKGILSFKDEHGDIGICCSGLDAVFSKKNVKLYPTVNLTNFNDKVSMTKIEGMGKSTFNQLFSTRSTSALSENSVVWRTLIEMMRSKSLDDSSLIYESIAKFHNILEEAKQDVWMYKIYMSMIAKDANIMCHYQKYTYKQKRKPAAITNFIEITKLMGTCSHDFAKFSTSLFESGCLDTLETVLSDIIKANMSISIKKDILLPILILICNLSKISAIRDEILQRKIDGLLEKHCSDNICAGVDVESFIPILCIMSLGYIKYEDSRSKWTINSHFLDIIASFAESAALDGKVGDDFFILPKEALDTLASVLDNNQNILYLLRQGVTGKFNGILNGIKEKNDCLTIALQCLIKLLTKVVELQRENSHNSSLRDSVGVKRLRETLKDLSSGSSSIECQINSCLNKLDEIEKGVAVEKKCLLKDLTAELMQCLNFSSVYFDSKYDRCFCINCHSKRNDQDYYSRGEPSRTYALPIGWYRFGLVLPPFAEEAEAVKKWHRAYHGTKTETIPDILRHGFLLLPGDYTASGHRLTELPNHFNDERKPEGFNTKCVFVSPSLRYSTHYSPGSRWKDKYVVKMCFQVLMAPNTYKIGPQTIGQSKQIDQKFSNDELEWFTMQRACHALYGLLINIEPIEKNAILSKTKADISQTDMGNNLSDLGDIESKTSTLIRNASGTDCERDNYEGQYHFQDEFTLPLDAWEKRIKAYEVNPVKAKQGCVPQWFKQENVFQWDKIDSSDNFTITDEKITIRKNISKTSSDLAKCTEGLYKGIHVYQIYWPKETRRGKFSIIGLSTDSVSKRESSLVPLCGQNENSFGWDLNSKEFYYKNEVIHSYPENCSPSFVIPDYFKMIVDFKRGTLSFGTNDIDYGICFTGITELFTKQNKNLFLTVSISSKNCEISVAKLPYLLKSEGYYSDLETFTKVLLKILDLIAKINEYSLFKDFLKKLLKFLRVCYCDSILYETILTIIMKSQFFEVANKMLRFFTLYMDDHDIQQSYRMMCKFFKSCSKKNAMFAKLAFDNSFIDLLHIVMEAEKLKLNPNGILLCTLQLIKQGCKISEISGRILEKRDYYINFTRCHLTPDNIKLVTLTISILLCGETFELDETCANLLIKYFNDKLQSTLILEILRYALRNERNYQHLFDMGIMNMLGNKLENLDPNDLTSCEHLLNCLSVCFSMTIKTIRKVDTLPRNFNADRFIMELEKLKGNEFDDLISTCILKLNEIKRIKDSEICQLKNLCDKYFKTELSIRDSYKAERHSKCFCHNCHLYRKDNDYYHRGKPLRKYVLPLGWYRIGLNVHDTHATVYDFEDWHRAYLPISFSDSVKEVIESRNSEIRESATRFVSPSIKYCSYTSQSRRYGAYDIKLAFQVLVRPDSYTAQGRNGNKQLQFDPSFSNTEIEWFVENDNSLIIYGLLIKADLRQK